MNEDEDFIDIGEVILARRWAVEPSTFAEYTVNYFLTGVKPFDYSYMITSDYVDMHATPLDMIDIG